MNVITGGDVTVEPDSPPRGKLWRRWRRKVYVGPTASNGWGVFAHQAVKPGEVVLVFSGPRLRRTDLLTHYAYAHSLQIGTDDFLGPSGGEDDFVNHACEPNTTLCGRRSLVALHHIEAGEEITVDYATLTHDPGWCMACFCGSPACRDVIRSYWETPKAVRDQPHFRTWVAHERSEWPNGHDPAAQPWAVPQKNGLPAG